MRNPPRPRAKPPLALPARCEIVELETWLWGEGAEEDVEAVGCAAALMRWPATRPATRNPIPSTRPKDSGLISI